MKHLSSPSHAYGFFAALPVWMCACAAVSQPAQAPAKENLIPTKFAALSVFDGAIIGIDTSHNTLKVRWPSNVSFEPKQTTNIVLTTATRFRREERGRKLSDLKVGDILLEVRNNSTNQKGANAQFSAQQLDVVSLTPLRLNVRGSSGGSWTPPKPKPGQTQSEALAESLVSDELPGIGAYVPHRYLTDPKTGQKRASTTIEVAEPSKMILTRSVGIAPLSINDFHIGQRVSFGITTRPDGKLTVDVIRLIVEYPQASEK